MRKLLTVIISVLLLCTVCVFADDESGQTGISTSEISTLSETAEPINPDTNNETSITLDGKKIRFGFADGYSRMQINYGSLDGPAGMKYGNREQGMGIYLGMAYVNDDDSIESLSKEVYGTITNVNVSSDNQDIISDGNINLTKAAATFDSSLEVWYIDFTTIPGAAGTANIILTFDVTINNVLYTVTCRRQITSYVVNTIDINLADSTNYLDDLNNIFSTKERFKNYFSSKGIHKYTNIRVILPKAKSLNGILTIDCGLKNVDYGNLSFYTNGEGGFTEDDKFTINGGIWVKSGNPSFQNIKIQGSEEHKIGEQKIGIYADPGEYDGFYNPADLDNIHNVTFSDLDCGVMLKDCYTGNVQDSQFINCTVGIYIDATYTNVLGRIAKDIFENCTTGIEIKSFYSGAYFLECNSLEFYNNKESYADFKVHNSEPYTCTGNYYGVTRTAGKTVDNRRTAVVSTAGGVINRLATNPCLMYPGETVPYGIDISGNNLTRIIYGTGDIQQIRLNTADSFDLEFADKNSKSIIGSLSFGGNS